MSYTIILVGNFVHHSSSSDCSFVNIGVYKFCVTPKKELASIALLLFRVTFQIEKTDINLVILSRVFHMWSFMHFS